MTQRPLALPLAIALLHLVLALVFASLTPYRSEGYVWSQGNAKALDIGAPDERQHANYIARIARGEGVATFNPHDPNLYETYQAHQPPLYYFLGGAWAKVTGADPTAKTDGFRLRALNALVGAAGVLGVYFLALWGFRREDIAKLAALFSALLPMNLGLSGSVGNDPLLLALCTWTLALVAKGVRDGWTTKLLIGTGVLTAAAILTKTTGVALLPALLVAAFLRRPSAKQLAFVLVPILVLVTPWWARNQSLYGDPLAMKAFTEAFTGSMQAKTMIDRFGATAYWTEGVVSWTSRSFVGVFGYMDVWLTDDSLPSGAGGLYWLVQAMLVAAFVGWLVSFAKAEPEDRKINALHILFALVVVFLFIRFNTQYFQAQARYILPAIGPIACGVALGIATLLKSRPAFAVLLVVFPLVVADAAALTKISSEFPKRMAGPMPRPQ
jgi:4-amino-4-deoxy-L-arabinose transferase-like glycosyltransferase